MHAEPTNQLIGSIRKDASGEENATVEEVAKSPRSAPIMVPYVVRSYTDRVTMETDAKIKEAKKQMVSIEEHRELEKRMKQLEKDRDEARSALLAQREDTTQIKRASRMLRKIPRKTRKILKVWKRESVISKENSSLTRTVSKTFKSR